MNCRVKLGSEVEYLQMKPVHEKDFWDSFKKFQQAGYRLLQIIEREAKDNPDVKIWIGVLSHG